MHPTTLKVKSKTTTFFFSFQHTDHSLSCTNIYRIVNLCFESSLSLSSVNSSYYNDGPFYQDNYQNQYQQPPPLMSTTPLLHNYSNSYDRKPSDTIERLQTFLENPKSSENSNHYQWSSSRYTSRSTSDNQTFTRNDAEQLLNYVQRFRH